VQVTPLGGSRDEKWRECVLCRFLLQSLRTIFLCGANCYPYYLPGHAATGANATVGVTGNSRLRKEETAQNTFTPFFVTTTP
jgi:3'-phosphoadenosine 5'-phosphosulfate sulfotransferase